MAADHTINGPYTIIPYNQILPSSTTTTQTNKTITLMPPPFNGAVTGGATRPASGVVFPLIS